MKSIGKIAASFAIAALILSAAGASNLLLASGQRPPLKEEEDGQLIKKRLEWFYSSRRAGADGHMAARREAAAEMLRWEMQQQETASMASWVPVGPFSSNYSNWRFGKVSGRIAALAKDFNNNILYLGSASGGLWKSTDDGVSWKSIFDTAGTQTVGAIAIDPKNSQTLWIGTGENVMWCERYFGIGLMKTTDGGATWEKRNGSTSTTLSDLSTFASVIVDPRNSNRLIVGGQYGDCNHGKEWQGGGIYTSDDAGATWNARLSDAYVTKIVQDPIDPNILWAGIAYAGVYKSSDNGNSWQLQTAVPVGYGRIEVAVAPSNGYYVYALYENVNGQPEFWRTTNGGTSWAKMTSGNKACDGQCWYDMVVKVHPADPNIVFRGTIELYKSANGGKTWKTLTGHWGATQKVHQDTHALLLDPSNGNTMYIGCDGGIWKTANGGVSFTNLNSNVSATQFYDIGIHPTDNGIIVGGSQDNASLYRSGSDRWDLLEPTGDGFISFFNPAKPTTVYTASYPWDWGGKWPSVLCSIHGLGGPFGWMTGQGSGITPDDRIAWVTPYALDPQNPWVLYLGTHRMYRSTDDAVKWNRVGPSDMTGGGEYDTVTTVNPAPVGGKYVYAGTSDSRIWRSSDSGANWAQISTGLPAGRYINDISPDPTNPSKALCVLGGFGTSHLYENKGSGAWVARGRGLPDVPTNTVLMIDAKTVYVGTDVGVFKSTNRGVSFMPFNTGMPLGLVIMDIEYNTTTKTMTAGTYGRGAWQIGPLAD